MRADAYSEFRRKKETKKTYGLKETKMARSHVIILLE
jgi:hypothetical protein